MPKGKNFVRETKDRFVCSICNYEVDNKKGIFLHLKYSHPDIKLESFRNLEAERDFRCTLCNKVYSKKERASHSKKCTRKPF